MAGPQDELKARIEALLTREVKSKVQVKSVDPLAGGACQENLRVSLFFEDGELFGARQFVLRSDSKQSLPGSLGRKDEYAVIQAALAAGVQTPKARWLTEGLVREGRWAYFLDWLDGEAIGRRVVRNKELEAARQALPEALAANLAKIHAIRPPGLDLPNTDLTVPPTTASLRFARKMMDGLPEPRPALELAMKWLERNEPAPVDPALLHGDFRTGNFMVTSSGLEGILDWEFAHYGDPAEDLAWISVRDWRFGRLDMPVGGFARRQPFYEAYQRHAGVKLDPARIRWWEIMGNVRWATGSIYQGERYLSGEVQDLELIAIARRASEMEFEALRLIERAR